MQVGLNMLLQQAKPDRLLIEPTGLGHPKQILSLLTSEVYHNWITLNATLCLLDPRQLSDQRVIDNENFRDQLACADVIVANKADVAQPQDQQALETWYRLNGGGRQLVIASQGAVDPALLDLPRLNQAQLPDGKHHHVHAEKRGLAALSLPGTQRWRRAVNQGDGYTSCGWIFDGDTQFDTAGILDWARMAPVDRVKGILRIKEGTLLINRQGNDLHIETKPVAPLDSRIELITRDVAQWNELQSLLLKVRLSCKD
jgi:G3E family GTPase